MPNESGLTPLEQFAQHNFLIGTPPVMVYTQDGQRVDRELLAILVQMRLAQANESLAIAMNPAKLMLVVLSPEQALDFRETVGELDKIGIAIDSWDLISDSELDVWLNYSHAEAEFILGQEWQARKQWLAQREAIS